MSYNEYFDLYLLAQKNPKAPYYMVSFDVVSCRKLSAEEIQKMYENIWIIMRYVYCRLLKRERELNRPVVLRDEEIFRPWEYKMKGKDTVILCGNMDPFFFGDCFQFTVLRDTVSKEEIVAWVNECKNKLGMKEDFHIADGYYETNNYAEGDVKFFRWYCIQTLETFHKRYTQQGIKRVKRRIKYE